ncbi:hypothetical protein NLM27_27480 [Bradyrhizobium sp. CCGB12]|uniref:hypothetical protein n=1 Tax=Bradyrhizobium sp. CCGB12 TaxID=2949632 RepID=UPI0020B23816|nr:hypothetical protein [Bradyrhizobium sp. CCGB12]MCP3392491.1 hypothetical protein [Bradyrhizobium sp. CCGB12]
MKDKFIAFVDIIGFSAMVKAEEGAGRDLSRPLKLAKLLGSSEQKFFPSVCPNSRRVSPDIDLKLTQISDCVVVSVEASPAGVINLIHYCHFTALKLLAEGALCRGYVTRGNIHHEDQQFIGTGYQHAVANEKWVAFMRADTDEKGTPFIQVDDTVLRYVATEGDTCVKKLFDRMVRSDGTYAAVYPFGVLSKTIGAIVGLDFNPWFWKEQLQRSVGYRRQDLAIFEEAERSAPDESAKRKIRHYKRGLEEAIDELRVREGALDHMIATGIIPFGTVW